MHVHIAVGLEDHQGVAQLSGMSSCGHGKTHPFPLSSSPPCRMKEKLVFLRKLFHDILHGF